MLKANFNISACKISDIINMKGKKHQNWLLTGKRAKNTNATKVHTPVIKFKVASHVLNENKMPQRTIAKSLNISVRTANKIIKSDLKLIKTNK